MKLLLMMLVRWMFTMSPSTAACERGFSAMITIKNIRRVRMGDDTLSTLMRINSMHQTVANLRSRFPSMELLNVMKVRLIQYCYSSS